MDLSGQNEYSSGYFIRFSRTENSGNTLCQNIGGKRLLQGVKTHLRTVVPIPVPAVSNIPSWCRQTVLYCMRVEPTIKYNYRVS
jgi:hypothetical protein